MVEVRAFEASALAGGSHRKREHNSVAGVPSRRCTTTLNRKTSAVNQRP